ncbi:MAG: hypothetical protein A2583_00455 [Bdellovibrionales bacterium RIFOXYD1_FULL_53_11]|nr:MAG: hypothetical protein A2583_00455 [Bdellovibrionales bacterium RIFOXYD1_FULL_53_11]
MLKRTAIIILLAAMVFTASRAIVRGLPGDPLDTLTAETGSPLAREELAHELGLDKPFFQSLAADAIHAIRGDFGRSILTRQSVAPQIIGALSRTLALTMLALAIGLGISIMLGLAAAGWPGPARARLDSICTAFGALTAALPTPWLGPMLIYTLSVWLPVFPVGDSIVLPAITLAIGFSGFWSRLIRERVRETLAFGAASGARARGLHELRVVFKYGLMPSAGALGAYLGTQIGALMAGAFITETVFDWPGMGLLLIEAVLKRDYPVVEAAVFVAGSLSLIGTALGDWTQSRMDPRLRDSGGSG